jgi:hypothetical protein
VHHGGQEGGVGCVVSDVEEHPSCEGDLRVRVMTHLLPQHSLIGLQTVAVALGDDSVHPVVFHPGRPVLQVLGDAPGVGTWSH